MEQGLRWFVRRANDNDSEILYHIKEIVVEGFDYSDPCNYIGHKEVYVDEIVYGSTMTLINSYNQLSNLNKSSQMEIYKFIISKFYNLITKHYEIFVEECE